MFSSAIVNFYCLWHGKLHLPGSGWILSQAACFSARLSRYPLSLPENQKIEIDFTDVSSAMWLNHLLGDRSDEDGLVRAIQQVTRSNSVIWDIGANCGVLSYRLAKQGLARKIIFFEPNPSLYNLAVSALRPFGSVSGMQCALSDKTGALAMTIPNRDSSCGTLEPVRTRRTGRQIEVRCEMGDDLVAAGRAEAPDIVKIDVEGHEAAVLQGMAETIRRHQPVIFFEHISLQNDEIRGMVPDDYDIFSVSDADGSIGTAFDRSKGHNSLMVPNSHRRK